MGKALQQEGSVSCDVESLIASLRAAGADRLAPAQLRYVESLADRATAHEGSIRRMLDAKLARAVGALRGKLDAQQEAGEAAKPDSDVGPLRELVRHLERSSANQADAHAEAIIAPRAELKAVRESRKTWGRLSAGKQVAQALEQAPRNAGPINSHMLMLRSLALMREISPDYLNRFISYADTLLCLDQREKDKLEKVEKPKKSKVSRPAKK